jgi:putative CocE/NonD family hydrolase
VDVDVRGSGASFGNRPWDYAPDEIRDGADLADWIVQQPWSNGRIATAGASYTGSTAEFALVNRHPAIVAAVNISSEFDQYTDILFPGGVQLGFYLNDWGSLTSALDRNQLPDPDWRERLALGGVAPTDDRDARALRAAAVAGHAANYDFRELTRFTYRNDFLLGRSDSTTTDRSTLAARRASEQSAFAWLSARFGPQFRERGVDLASQHAYANDIAASGAAHYAIAGWFDGAYANAMIRRFNTYRQPGTRLLIGPWDHQQTNVSPYSGGDATRFALQDELLHFLDATVGQRTDAALAADARVHYYTMGAEQWRTADSWPPTATSTAMYFAADHVLSRTPPADALGADHYTVDFSVGTGTRTRWNTLMGRRLRTPYPDRTDRDQLLPHYDSAPVASDVEVTGHPLAHLTVRSTASDGAFFVYLEDVWPDGHVTMVTEGQLRALHRKVSDAPRPYWTAGAYHTFRREDAQLLVPGEVATLDFELEPTSYVFKRGHRMRISVAGADRDHFARVPADSAQPVIVTIERSATFDSHVVLPIVGSTRP